MNDNMIIRRAMLLVVSVLIATGSGIVAAFDFGNIMNPSRWMGGNRYDDYYGDRWGGPGYGYGAPGLGYAPGYGPPPYGAPAYGIPGYSAPGLAPGYTAPAAGGAPSDNSAKEIEQLKQRIKELEEANARMMAPPIYGSGQSGYAPAASDYGEQGGYAPVAPGYGEQGGYAAPSKYGGQSQYQSSPPSYGGQTTYRPVQPDYGNQVGNPATPSQPAFGGQPVSSPSTPSGVQ